MTLLSFSLTRWCESGQVVGGATSRFLTDAADGSFGSPVGLLRKSRAGTALWGRNGVAGLLTSGRMNFRRDITVIGRIRGQVLVEDSEVGTPAPQRGRAAVHTIPGERESQATGSSGQSGAESTASAEERRTP